MDMEPQLRVPAWHGRGLIAANLLWWLLVAIFLAACSREVAMEVPTGNATETVRTTPTVRQHTTTSTTPSETPTGKVLPTQAATQTTRPDPTATALPRNASQLPDADDFTWVVVAEGLDLPVGTASAKDGSGRLFVIEQAGLIKVVQDGEILSQPFLDLRDRVSTRGGAARGLLGIVFHPTFADNGYFYVHYTNQQANSVIARFSTAADSLYGDPNSEKQLLEISYPVGEHVGGDLNFGLDGYLYISIGDGGGPGYGDQEGNAQNPGSYLGKILRVDVDSGVPYSIPQDNPYAGGGGKPEVWLSGLRNPWRFAIDPLLGDTYIADVGENLVEELNYLPAGSPGGENFGWNYYEGSRRYSGDPGEGVSFETPIIEYGHDEGCSITGGEIYRGTELPEWYGVYVYGDYCQGNIWGLLRTAEGEWIHDQLYKLPAYITSFGEDEAGEIYLVDITGKIYKLVRK